MARFEEVRPKLRHCTVHLEGFRVVLEEIGSHRHFILPAETRALVEKFDGTRTVREIITELHHDKAELKFKIVLETIEQLERAGFLELVGAAGRPKATAKSILGWHERLSRWRNLNLKMVLIPKVNLKFKAPLLFYAAAILMMVMSVFSLATGNFHHIENNFLLGQGSYLKGLLFYLVAGAGLLTAKCLFQCVCMLLASGRIYGLCLKLDRFSVHLSVADSSIYLMRGRTGPTLFYISSLASLFVFTWLAALWGGPAHWVSDLKTLTVLFVLFELNPYRATELQRLFFLFLHDNLSSQLRPYLNSRSLFSFFRSGDKIANESAMVSYAAFSLAWSSTALYFLSCVLQTNGANMLLGCQAASLPEKGAAAFIFARIGLVWSYLWLDLAATLLKNLIYPLRGKIAQTRQNLMTQRGDVSRPEVIREILSKNPLFEGMDDPKFTELLRSADVCVFPKGTALIIQGLENRKLFAVVRGGLRVIRHEPSGAATEVALLGPSSVIGEVSVLGDHQGTADVVAGERTECVVIDREIVRKMGPSAMLEKITLGHFIGSSPIFQKLPKETLQLITRRGRLTTRGAGEVACAEGTQGDTLYLLVRGRVEVMRQGRKFKELAQGDFFGEIALISRVPRSATVRTLSECVFLELDADAFWELLAENIQFSLLMESIADMRSREIASKQSAA